MATRKFRLATLLKLREMHRDERRTEMAEAQRARDHLEAQIRELDGDLGTLLRERMGEVGQAINVDRMLEAARYELVLRSQQQVLSQYATNLETELDKRRVALLEADRNVRVLEKLSEQQQQRIREEELRKEMQQLDEVAQRRNREETLS